MSTKTVTIWQNLFWMAATLFCRASTLVQFVQFVPLRESHSIKLTLGIAFTDVAATSEHGSRTRTKGHWEDSALGT